MVHASSIGESIVAPTLFRPEFSHTLDPEQTFGRCGSPPSGEPNTSDFSILEIHQGVASTRLFGNCTYGFGVARQLYYSFCRKAHGDGGTDANFALKIQVSAMHFDK